MLPIRVTITDMGDTITAYTMDHDDPLAALESERAP